MRSLFDEKRCDCCGKNFVCPDIAAWRYKKTQRRGYLIFCSWSCLEKHRRKEKK